tara:strand:+ start:1454 stop:2008 length:555 start_codon:yes stop_codon:yes gene_type:complete
MSKPIDFKELCTIKEKKTTVGLKASIIDSKLQSSDENESFEEIINKCILEHLVNSYENKCTNDGFVIPKSIKIIERSKVYFPKESLKLHYTADVIWSMKICCPNPDTILNCRVVSKNKIGVLGTLNNDISPLIILIPFDLIEDIDENSKISEINIGDNINVLVLGKKFEQSDKKIIVIGKPVFT